MCSWCRMSLLRVKIFHTKIKIEISLPIYERVTRPIRKFNYSSIAPVNSFPIIRTFSWNLPFHLRSIKYSNKVFDFVFPGMESLTLNSKSQFFFFYFKSNNSSPSTSWWRAVNENFHFLKRLIKRFKWTKYNAHDKELQITELKLKIWIKFYKKKKKNERVEKLRKAEKNNKIALNMT